MYIYGGGGCLWVYLHTDTLSGYENEFVGCQGK